MPLRPQVITECLLTAKSFADVFLLADELAHLKNPLYGEGKVEYPPNWGYVGANLADITLAANTLIAHTDEEGAKKLALGMARVEHGVKNHDLVEINMGAEQLQATALAEGLVALIQECK
jgi:hypothetical protein